MADSSSDVLQKEFCLFIHWNAFRTQQIGFNVIRNVQALNRISFLRFGLVVS